MKYRPPLGRPILVVGSATCGQDERFAALRGASSREPRALEGKLAGEWGRRALLRPPEAFALAPARFVAMNARASSPWERLHCPCVRPSDPSIRARAAPQSSRAPNRAAATASSEPERARTPRTILPGPSPRIETSDLPLYATQRKAVRTAQTTCVM